MFLLQLLYHPLSNDEPCCIKTSILSLSMCLDFIWASLFPSLSKVNVGGAPVYQCACVASAKTSVSVRPGCQTEAQLEILRVLTPEAERLSALLKHWLQEKSLSLRAASV